MFCILLIPLSSFVSLPPFTILAFPRLKWERVTNEEGKYNVYLLSYAVYDIFHAARFTFWPRSKYDLLWGTYMSLNVPIPGLHPTGAGNFPLTIPWYKVSTLQLTCHDFSVSALTEDSISFLMLWAGHNLLPDIISLSHDFSSHL